ncbi:hypothetical protein [Paraburkholderia rhizosphaerae]|uniref:Lipoprotein n=1 Tax=Paraburkholderia rhizosphaerae TaxID=480658 RepID=A0A4R8LWE7_9BURK|nr:hypothetical protein [Paraburkholderia rhizosphaerae]TDY52234.1 hypothetical protein BX592_105118 [Paraburkholderia rhizosphaerae]
MKKLNWLKAWWLPVCLLAACSSTHNDEPNRENLTAALSSFLDAHGDMCIGKMKWPIDITKDEAQQRTANSLQLPVLEKVGLVHKQQISDSTMRYTLSDEGKKYYLDKQLPSMAANGTVTMHQGDVCYGKLHIDKVIGWDLPHNVNGTERTVITYTYTIEAAPWTRDPDVQRVFPVVAMVVRSGGALQLKQVVVLTKDGWQGEIGFS